MSALQIGILLELLSSGFFSLFAIYNKILLGVFSVMALLLGRNLGNFTFFSIFYYKKLSFYALLRPRKAALLRALFSLIGLYLWLTALDMISVKDVTAIFFLIPTCNLIFSRAILNESVRPLFYVSNAIGFAGILICLDLSTNPLRYGHAIATLGAIFWSLSAVFLKKIAICSDRELLLVQATGILTGLSLLFYSPNAQFTETVQILPLLVLVSISVAATYFQYSAYVRAPLNTLQAVGYSRLPFTLIFAFIFLGETLNIQMMVGMILIVASGIIPMLEFPQKAIQTT